MQQHSFVYNIVEAASNLSSSSNTSMSGSRRCLEYVVDDSEQITSNLSTNLDMAGAEVSESSCVDTDVAM